MLNSSNIIHFCLQPFQGINQGAQDVQEDHQQKKVTQTQ